MRSLRATSTGMTTSTTKGGLPPQGGVHWMPASWRESLASMAVVMVGLVAFVFVLIVLPWAISI